MIPYSSQYHLKPDFSCVRPTSMWSKPLISYGHLFPRIVLNFIPNGVSYIDGHLFGLIRAETITIIHIWSIQWLTSLQLKSKFWLIPKSRFSQKYVPVIKWATHMIDPVLAAVSTILRTAWDPLSSLMLLLLLFFFF